MQFLSTKQRAKLTLMLLQHIQLNHAKTQPIENCIPHLMRVSALCEKMIQALQIMCTKHTTRLINSHSPYALMPHELVIFPIKTSMKKPGL